ncbi:superoxide dismutase family protein [Hymenobacter crusticola]|uniref:Superoxide dismutase copper/zinc binding domain-containing protein n=1 Tax=Hymenobacter crusticola TaxID=1770526 RepID=A0A243WHU8_9BACT|nr:superoxide dismutase family protein [Hymenobacter crusticola]OUJ75389.1 hypothetical protein BXP70_05080 [Hymenobacter crusticola]
MKRLLYLSAFLSLGAVTSCDDDETGEIIRLAHADLEAKSGSSLTGTVSFSQLNGRGVRVYVVVSGATPGLHAVHLHQNGDCSGPTAMNVGTHWNPTSEPHGRRGTPPFHRGDIGNITVNADGTGVLALTAEDWTIGGADASRDILNKAVIVHAGADDYVTQPSGNSGVHVGCGVVTDDL